MNFLCLIFGHRWLFNFSWMPSHAICKRCRRKADFDLHDLEWYPVDKFGDSLGTDDEIIKRWSYKKTTK